MKHYLDLDVLAAAQERISFVFDHFERVSVSFSGGKDSAVLLHLVAAEARRRCRRFTILFVDFEAQYRLTIEFIERMLELYGNIAHSQWAAVPIVLRNAVSMYQPRWLCWDPECRDMWVREKPPHAVADFPFFRPGMEFEEFMPAWGEWFAGGHPACCLIGIRADESINRFRTIMHDRTRFRGRRWTVQQSPHVFTAYPIYDWRTEDIWTFNARTGLPYNPLYDRMHRAGLKPSQMRICQPYGDDQRRGLWLYHVIEPQTWPRVVARVNGANGGALYARESGNVLGNLRIKRPPGHTWRSFAGLLLGSLPPPSRLHFENKIAVFRKWYRDRGFDPDIPDEADARAEARHEVPSWRRICKALLRNDWWCKGLGFSQTKSEAYGRYLQMMKKRRESWGL